MKRCTYTHHITKEQVNLLPLTQFDGEVFIIDCPEQVEDAVAYLNRQSVIGVDTESRPSFTRGVHYPTALVQIASRERCYLFRLTHVGMPESLAAVFTNPAICKVGLAFKDDLNGLKRRRMFVPRNCIDLQSIVGKYGILDLGLQKIFAICFNKKISKAQQLTNWENSHLTLEQARYASTDAWATLLIYQDLMEHEPLPKKEAERLRQEELARQQQHQQEIINERNLNKALDAALAPALGSQPL